MGFMISNSTSDITNAIIRPTIFPYRPVSAMYDRYSP